MNQANIPTHQRFRRFERVQLQGLDQTRLLLEDSVGTVVSADPPQSTDSQRRWSYCVHLHGHHRDLNVLESNLRSIGEFGAEDEYLGTGFEISHDLLPDDDGNFSFHVEGTYRLPGKFWQVMIFIKGDVPTLRHRMTTWDSGITGIVFEVPDELRLDKAFVEQAMSRVFDTRNWIEVCGPDSMTLR